MTEPMHYPDYPDICGSIRSMANAVSGLGVVTKLASQIRIEKRLWEIADALEKRYKEDRARGVAQQAPAAFIAMASPELIALAEKEWTNRVERKQPPYDKRSWISGWFDGYFSKPKEGQAPAEPPEICCKCEDTPDVCGSTQRKCEDAALIAQEREKWEREHTKKPGCYNSCPFDDLCANDIEKIQEIERMAAAQAREDVLDELAQMYANVPEQFLEGTYRLHSEWKEKIESLRHGQKQERDPE